MWIAFGAVGCVQAFGDADDDLPTGAELVDYDTFYDLLASGRLREVFSRDQVPRATAPQTASGTVAEDPVLRELADRSPVVRRRLTTEVTADGDLVTQTADGNFLLKQVDRLGRTQTFRTVGSKLRLAGISASASRFRSASNQSELYRMLLSGYLARGGAAGAYPSLSRAASLDARELTELNASLAASLAKLPGAEQGSGSRASSIGMSVDQCIISEEGSDPSGSDQTDWSEYCPASPKGINAIYDYPAKPWVTCVKNQRSRGTCEAFATSSVLEMSIARAEGGRKVNLSEQELYFYATGYWPDDISTYDDGALSAEILDQMLVFDYSPKFESAWPYNPSFRWCKDYPGWCSKTAHQGKLLCAKHDGKLHCGFATPVSGTGLDRTLRRWIAIWDLGDPSRSLDRLRAVLDLNQASVILEIDVTVGFALAGISGWGGFTPNEELGGGHAMHVVGYITNERLAALRPDAVPGPGGGYLIIKNSWGVCSGDAGFYYMPFDWAKSYVTAANGVVEIQ